MIYLYSGTPGSGKSLQMAHEVVRWVKSYKKNVITNTPISLNAIMGKNLKKKKHGLIYNIDNSILTVDFLYRYALRFHKEGKESQTLIVIDEAQTIFHPNVMKLECQENKFYRKEWLDFFTQHRHLGYDILLITQFDKLLDAQVRCLIEYNYVHRKANNFQAIGKFLTLIGLSLFVQIQKWYGVNAVSGTQYFTYNKRFANIYDSYGFRKKIILQLSERYGADEMEKIMGFVRPKKRGKVVEKVSDNKVS